MSLRRSVLVGAGLLGAVALAGCGAAQSRAVAPPPRTAAATGGQLAALRVPTTSPAGAIVPLTADAMPMGDGMKMVTAACTAMPSAAQQAATVRLVDTSWKAAEPYRSLSAAIAAGYQPITPTGLPVVHYLSLARYLHVEQGGPVVDPAAPDSLVYANTPRGAVLVASMFLSAPGTTSVAQPGGCLTQWHEHTNLCQGSLGTIVGLVVDGRCTAGTPAGPTAPMMHVWYVPIPGGPTAVDAPDGQVVRAAEQVAAPPNGTA